MYRHHEESIGKAVEYFRQDSEVEGLLGASTRSWKPAGLLESIEALYQDTSVENARQFYESVKGFRDWGVLATGWPVQFMLDSELNWQNGATPIDDV